MSTLLLCASLALAQAQDPVATELTENPAPPVEPPPVDAWAAHPNSLRLTLTVFYSGLVGGRYDRVLGQRWTLGASVSTLPSTLHLHARFRPVTFNGVFSPALELAAGAGGFLQQLENGEDPWVMDAAAMAGFEYRAWGGFNLDFGVSGGPTYLPRSDTLLPFVLGLRLGVGGAW
ncbi:MAG: hypothetical protein H6741_08720 [Alphaproteobacteria bacterium]|nr:hypothetical protein [Alphaproteobacteria bacterium]